MDLHTSCNNKRNARKIVRIASGAVLIVILYVCCCMDFDYRRYPLDIDFSALFTNDKPPESKQINSFPFKYRLNNENTCNKKKFLIIVVKSALENYIERNIIRETWGQHVAKESSVGLAFVVGSDKYGLLQDNITQESRLYNDIVQMEFLDSYRNLTYKTMMAYNWVTKYCRNADFAFIVDDDIYINLRKTLLYFKEIPKNKPLLSGSKRNGGFPVRCGIFSFLCKYSVTREEYPFDWFPPYLYGRHVLVSTDIVKRFDKIFPYIKYFWIEDVFVGIAASKLLVVPENNPHIDFYLQKLEGNLSEHIAFHQFDLRLVHKKLLYDKVTN